MKKKNNKKVYISNEKLFIVSLIVLVSNFAAFIYARNLDNSSITIGGTPTRGVQEMSSIGGEFYKQNLILFDQIKKQHGGRLDSLEMQMYNQVMQAPSNDSLQRMINGELHTILGD